MADNANPAAVYQPLEESRRVFRLLRLQPTNDDTIQCQLAVFSLECPPVYTALSYCWGTEDPTLPIRLHSLDFFVRPNLYAYLQVAKNEMYDGWIFIDAICINQADTAERSSQVGMMGDIYRSADRVIAWLGAPSPTRILRRWRERRSLTQWKEIDSVTMSEETLVAGLAEEFNRVRDELSHEWLTALSHCWGTESGRLARESSIWLAQEVVWILASADYWTRLWVVQELLLARMVILRYGPLDVDEILLRPLVVQRDNIKLKQTQSWETGLRSFICNTVDTSTTLPKDQFWLVLRERRHNDFGPANRGYIGGLLVAYGENSTLMPDYHVPMSELYIRVLIEHGQAKPNIFVRYLTVAFNWSILHPTVALITREATGRIPGEPIRRYYLGLSTVERIKFWTAFWKDRELTRLQLRSCRARNTMVSIPGCPDDARTYREWVELVKKIRREIKLALVAKRERRLQEITDHEG